MTNILLCAGAFLLSLFALAFVWSACILAARADEVRP